MCAKYQHPVCVYVCVLMCKLLSTAGLLDRLHSDDPVCACGFLHSRGLRPDDCVGQRQTPQLLKGVQRLSDPALLHTPLHPVEPGRENHSRYTHPPPHRPGPFKGPVHPLDVRKCVMKLTARMDFGHMDSI